MMFCFGLHELFFCWPASDKIGQDFSRQQERFFRLLFPGLQADFERSLLPERRKMAMNTVGQPTLLADFFHQTRGKSAAAEYVIADEQWKIIGIDRGGVQDRRAEYGFAWQGGRFFRCPEPALSPLANISAGFPCGSSFVSDSAIAAASARLTSPMMDTTASAA